MLDGLPGSVHFQDNFTFQNIIIILKNGDFDLCGADL